MYRLQDVGADEGRQRACGHAEGCVVVAPPGRLTRLAASMPCLLLLLSGFDDYVNMVLEDVTEYEITSEGKRITKLDSILLNGNNVALVRPPCIPHTLSSPSLRGALARNARVRARLTARSCRTRHSWCRAAIQTTRRRADRKPHGGEAPVTSRVDAMNAVVARARRSWSCRRKKCQKIS